MGGIRYRIAAYDLEVAEAHASLLAPVRKAGAPGGAHDPIIAATGLAREREAVTLDRAAVAPAIPE